jgi:hypothetical protein
MRGELSTRRSWDFASEFPEPLDDFDDFDEEDPPDADLARLQTDGFFSAFFGASAGVRSARARFGFAAEALLRVLPFWSTL